MGASFSTSLDQFLHLCSWIHWRQVRQWIDMASVIMNVSPSKSWEHIKSSMLKSVYREKCARQILFCAKADFSFHPTLAGWQRFVSLLLVWLLRWKSNAGKWNGDWYNAVLKTRNIKHSLDSFCSKAMKIKNFAGFFYVFSRVARFLTFKLL